MSHFRQSSHFRFYMNAIVFYQFHKLATHQNGASDDKEKKAAWLQLCYCAPIVIR